ncbi:MAG: efflux RND transporter permease subunit [Planctomycetes bacterium]|nr:efflux RND transporter permease subunit [Planctomycetota bacterium]
MSDWDLFDEASLAKVGIKLDWARPETGSYATRVFMGLGGDGSAGGFHSTWSMRLDPDGNIGDFYVQDGSYNSGQAPMPFLQPLVIMFSVPLATLGGFGALYIVFIWSEADRYLPSQKLDVLTMLGFILLIGVVVNNAILIVHQALNFMRGGGDIAGGFEGEMTPRRAIAESVRTRVRPIFMSMLTSVGGMLPLVLAPGAGSELYRGLGSVVVGGLLVSTIFTLLLVPMLLSLVFDLSAKFSVEESSPIPESLTPAGGLAATARRK